MANNNVGLKRIWATRLTDVSTTDKEGVGSRRIEGHKEYRYVQYDQGAGAIAAVAGNMTYYDGDTSIIDPGTCRVTSDLSDTQGIGAGMLLTVIPNLGFGWIQTKGIATLNLALTAGADGNALTAVGSTDGALDVSALVTDFICAVAVDASAKIVLLTCP